MSLKYAQARITAPERLEKHTLPPDRNFLSSEEEGRRGYEPSHAASSVVNSRSARVTIGFFSFLGRDGGRGGQERGS